MGAHISALASPYFVGMLPLALAGAGAYTTVRLAAAFRGTHRIGKRSKMTLSWWREPNAKTAAIMVLDVTAVILTAALVLIIWKDGTSTSALIALALASLFQAVVGVKAFLRVNAMLPNTGDGAGSRNLREGCTIASATVEKQLMTQGKKVLTRTQRLRMIDRGWQLYDELRPKIEKNHWGEFIAISVMTGDFVMTRGEQELVKFDHTLPEGDFIWTARVGEV